MSLWRVYYDEKFHGTFDMADMPQKSVLRGCWAGREKGIRKVRIEHTHTTPPRRSNVATILALNKFAQNILNPEVFGNAVTAEIRDAARVALGLPKVETKEKV